MNNYTTDPDDNWEEYDEIDDSPTGHGDICHSDADQGL
jgi:hypothetical protein